MNSTTRILIVFAAAAALAGCATPPGAKQIMCATAGALVAGAAGYYGTDHSDGAAAASAVAGGVIGSLLCQEPEAKPEPKPAPKPAPKPVPKPVVKVDPDSDGDGVPDSRDDCPNTTPGTPVDARGCPEIPDLKGVHFEFDKSTLTSEARRIMDGAAATLKKNPHVRVEVVGHTDSMGSDAYNQKLSEQRANAVRSYLEGAGVSSARVSASGRGESAPIASNDTSEGRQQNRRVEVTARPIK